MVLPAIIAVKQMIDKLQLANQIFLEYAKKCNSVSDIFTEIELFEKALIEKGYIKIKSCPLCGKKIEYIDLQGAKRAQCECIKVQGEDELEAYYLFLKKLSEV